MARPSAAIAAAIKATKTEVPPDKLEKIHAAARQARDLKVSLEERKRHLRDDNVKLYDLEHTALPELMMDARVKALTIDPEGNNPAFEVKLRPYYHANIREDWPDEQREEAFRYLEEAGAPDMIKTIIIVEVDRQDRKTAAKVEAALRKLRVPYASDKSVPWNTLTAWVREMIEKHGETPPLAVLGATVGSIVTIKPVKEK